MIPITRNPYLQMFRGRLGSLDRGHEIDPFPHDIVQDPYRPVGAFHSTHFPCRRETTNINENIFEIPSRFFPGDHRPEEKAVEKIM